MISAKSWAHLKVFLNFILEFLFFHCENQFAVLVPSVSPSSLVSSTARTIYYCFFEVDDRRHFLLPLCGGISLK